MYQVNSLLTKIDPRTVDLINDPFKKYRTLYFANNIDVRLCPKNANTTLRSVWSQLNCNSIENCSVGTRRELFERNLQIGNIDDVNYIFRKNSYRIAVKRNPIERALSAAKEVLKQELSIEDPSLENIEELLSIFHSDRSIVSENGLIGLNHHFFSQTYSMGTVYDYDEVYDIQDVDKLVKWLEDDYMYPFKVTNTRLNRSLNKIKVTDLSSAVRERIYNMYEIDYKNGWY